MSVLCTQPGTDTNETPDMDEPTIPMATTYHGERLLPKKNASLLVSLRPVSHDMSIRAAKYSAMTSRIV